MLLLPVINPVLPHITWSQRDQGHVVRNKGQWGISSSSQYCLYFYSVIALQTPDMRVCVCQTALQGWKLVFFRPQQKISRLKWARFLNDHQKTCWGYVFSLRFLDAGRMLQFHRCKVCSLSGSKCHLGNQLLQIQTWNAEEDRQHF